MDRHGREFLLPPTRRRGVVESGLNKGVIGRVEEGEGGLVSGKTTVVVKRFRVSGWEVTQVPEVSDRRVGPWFREVLTRRWVERSE